MGQAAEDIIDGACCAICGDYFFDDNNYLIAYGYPVACYSCWDEDCGYDLADE